MTQIDRLKLRIISKNAVIGAVIGTVTATSCIWEYAGIGERIFLGSVTFLTVWFELMLHDRYYEHLRRVEFRMEQKERMKKKKIVAG